MIALTLQFSLMLIHVFLIGITLWYVRDLAPRLLLAMGLGLSMMADLGTGAFVDLAIGYANILNPDSLLFYLTHHVRYGLFLLLDVVAWAFLLVGLIFLEVPSSD